MCLCGKGSLERCGNQPFLDNSSPLLSQSSLWSCLEFHQGRLVFPTTVDAISAFVSRFYTHMTLDAAPTPYAAKVYLLFCLFQAILAMTLPGPIVKGLPVPSLGGKRLEY